MSKFNAHELFKALEMDLRPYLSKVTAYPRERVPLHVKLSAVNAQLDGFLKKLIPGRSDELDLVAANTFNEYNKRCANWMLRLDSETDRQLWGEFTKICEDFFLSDLGDDVSLEWGNIAQSARCGPGSSVGGQSTTHYGKMYSGRLTASDPDLVSVYRADINLWPEESNAEIIRQEHFGSPVIVPGSRSCFVPKSAKTSRMISVEPTLNMFYQLGLGRILEKRLKRFFGIDLSTQPTINRYLAYVGSCVDASFGDGFATIDLSSASDSLSLRLGSYLIPEDWFSFLLSLRSHTTEIKLGNVVSRHRLEMISTMGNGFTFPLQTVIFACAASAVISMDDGIKHSPRGFGINRPGMFSVFGDDIVVPSRHFNRMLHLLKLMGCEPNEQKSFGSGSFRESCGHDYYHGHNIRPVYCRKVDTEEDLLVLANLLIKWGARLEMSTSFTVAKILSLLEKVNFVPMADAEDSGLRVPYEIVREFSGAGVQRNLHTQSWAYKRRVTHTKRMRVLEGTIQVPKGAKRHIYNPSGLFMSYLLGEIRGGWISLRAGLSTYRTKRAVTPNWDYSVPQLEDAFIASESPGVLTKRTTEILRDAFSILGDRSLKKIGIHRSP